MLALQNLAVRDPRFELLTKSESIEITHGYLEADLKLKEKAFQKLAPAGQAAPRFQADDPLLVFLEDALIMPSTK